MSKKEKDIEAQDTQLTPSTDNVQGVDKENSAATAADSSVTPKADEDVKAKAVEEETVNTDNSQAPNDVQQTPDKEPANDQVENDFDEIHSLHSFYFEPSESRTTNIPPRLPVGYSYTLFKSDSTNNGGAKTQQTKSQAPASHPDLPAEGAIAQNEEEMHNRSKRYRYQHKNKTWLAIKRWTRRYWIGLLIAAIVVVIVATFNVWMPIINHWQLEHKEETPVVAADTLPVPVKTEVDTTANVLSHEDSLRIQDSIRHARWLYWKKYKQAKEASQKAEVDAEDTGAANNAANASSATTNEHVPVHANDSTHH